MRTIIFVIILIVIVVIAYYLIKGKQQVPVNTTIPAGQGKEQQSVQVDATGKPLTGTITTGKG